MPDWKAEIRQRLGTLQLAPTREAAIIEELAQDLDDCYAALLASGASAAEAYQQTLLELQGKEFLSRELQRSERQHSRFGARMLAKQPRFTLIAVITLALGIGVNTGVFSVVYTVLLRPLPFPAPERLVVLATTGTQVDFRAGVSYPDYVDWRDRTHSFEATACFLNTGFNLTGVEPAVAARGRRPRRSSVTVCGARSLAAMQRSSAEPSAWMGTLMK